MSEATAERRREDLRIVGVIGAAHFTSHFFQLALSPLFPAIHDALSLSYGQLGALVSAFFTASAIGQVAVGFVVDRYGPQLVLPGGAALLAAAIGAIGVAGNYPMMMVCAAFAGLGNSVYHPADYSVLTARVTPSRLARAYSVHTISGTFGWAAAPTTVLFLSQQFGWRNALLIVGIAGVSAAACFALDRKDLCLPESIVRRHGDASRPGEALPKLLTLPVVVAFLYFTLLAIALGGTQNFLPTMLPKVQDVSVAFATQLLTAYLTINAVGSFAGGYLADVTRNHERIVAAGLAGAAVLMLALAFVPMAPWLLALVATLTGLLVGLTIPSRDMLVRSATPPGATGKVFGFVYSGLDLGSLIVPVAIGALLDRGLFAMPFVLIAASLFITIALAIGVKRSKD
jgi:predicted MFS family arabinose efflux permease